MLRATLLILVRSARVIACTALAVLAAATPSVAADSRVVVRVYDIGNSAADVRAAAMRRAAAIMRDAGLSLEWRDCTTPDGVPACTKSPANWNLIVRIIATFVPGTSTRSAVSARGSVVDADSPLGFAVVAPEAQADAMATIFDDQVQMVSRRTGVERSELLGRALAHEIGHLLLRAPGHSRTGLMRPVWTDGELTQNHPEDWVFAQADRRRLQLNLRRP